MSRAEQLLPDGWKPKAGSVVTVEPSKDDPTPPHGTWKVFSAAPGTGQWWLMPVDDASRAWAKRWPQAVTSGCVSRSGRTLVPRGFRRPRPSDLSATALQNMGGGGRR